VDARARVWQPRPGDETRSPTRTPIDVSFKILPAELLNDTEYIKRHPITSVGRLLSVDANRYPFVVVGKRLPLTDSAPPTPDEESVELALLFSAVSAAPYATMPKSAIAYP
jgi:hypothetical protein